MKRAVVSIFCLLVLTLTALPVGAQTRYRRFDGNRARRYQRWDRDRWERSFWDRHRDKLTTAIGAGAGTAIGAAVGGKKGAIIGAIVGGGGSAIYTYGIRDKNRRRY